jgi:hypothetical protein
VEGGGPIEGVMSAYVFAKTPKFCLGIKPGVIWVRCVKCGRPHREYLGPRDRDEMATEVEFLRGEVDRLTAMLRAEHAAGPPRRRSR